MSEGGSPTTLLVAADSQQDAKGNVRKMEDIEADIARLQAEKAAIPREAQLKMHVDEHTSRDHATRTDERILAVGNPGDENYVPASREEQLMAEAEDQKARDWATRT